MARRKAARCSLRCREAALRPARTWRPPGEKIARRRWNTKIHSLSAVPEKDPWLPQQHRRRIPVSSDPQEPRLTWRSTKTPRASNTSHRWDPSKCPLCHLHSIIDWPPIPTTKRMISTPQKTHQIQRVCPLICRCKSLDKAAKRCVSTEHSPPQHSTEQDVVDRKRPTTIGWNGLKEDQAS